MWDDDLLGGRYKADENTYELSEEQLAALCAGDLYINIHNKMLFQSITILKTKSAQRLIIIYINHIYTL